MSQLISGCFRPICLTKEGKKTLFDVQQLGWGPAPRLSSLLEARPERQSVEAFTYEATDGQMKLSASRSGICQHQSTNQTSSQPNRRPVWVNHFPVPSSERTELRNQGSGSTMGRLSRDSAFHWRPLCWLLNCPVKKNMLPNQPVAFGLVWQRQRCF